jgi:cobalt-zinc-cadmium efflux system outer membrane protein
MERRRSLVDLERSKRVPDVTFSLGVKRSNELQRDQLLFGVSVPLPLFDRNQGNLLEALKREDKARDELQALKVRVGTEVMQARERLDAIRREVEVLQRDVLPRAKSVYDAATIGFENGKFNFLEVLDAQRTYFAAKSQYLKALAEAHRAAADIDRVLGDSTPNADKPSNQE